MSKDKQPKLRPDDSTARVPAAEPANADAEPEQEPLDEASLDHVLRESSL